MIFGCFYFKLNKKMNTMKNYYVYLMASGKNGTLYVGFTNNLVRRVAEHKRKKTHGFTSTYSVDKLVWYLQCNDPRLGIQKEKSLKKWNRNWKVREIKKMNPEWKDLFYEIGGTEEMLSPDFQL